MVSPQRFTADTVEGLWKRAERVFEADRFSSMVQTHRQTTPSVRHRLIDQLIALDDARNQRLSWVREDAAVVSLPEVDSVLTFAEEAMASAAPAAWKEVRRGLAGAAEYLHAVGVLQVASLLRVHHPTTDFLTTSGTTREPDLILVVTDGLPLAVEVKAVNALWQPSSSLDMAEGRRLIRNTVASAGLVEGQLRADRPGVLALTGLFMSQTTYDTLAMCFEHHLSSEGAQAPHLLGFAVSNLRLRVESAPKEVSPVVEQQSTLRRNPGYTGALWIDDDWARPWRLIRR